MGDVRSYREIVVGGGDTAAPLNVARRLAMLESFAPLANARVLDCGCGSGGYVRALVARGVDAHGIEYSADKVAEYRRRVDDERVRVGDLTAMDVPTASFDVAVLNEVLEHVPDERAALREIRRVLRPGGVLVVFSPNRFYPFETHGATWRRSGERVAPSRTLFLPYVPLAVAERVFKLTARNYWPSELRALLEEGGFGVERTEYLWQTFENISGKQPAWIAPAVPWLRRAARILERAPVVRIFGVSQVLGARVG